MKPIPRFVAGLAVFLLAITIFAKVVSASGPIAVYALIDKVTLEPNSKHPQRILIYGVFSTAQIQNGSAYSKPQRGFRYVLLLTLKMTPGRVNPCIAGCLRNILFLGSPNAPPAACGSTIT